MITESGPARTPTSFNPEKREQLVEKIGQSLFKFYLRRRIFLQSGARTELVDEADSILPCASLGAEKKDQTAQDCHVSDKLVEPLSVFFSGTSLGDRFGFACHCATESPKHSASAPFRLPPREYPHRQPPYL